jgi:hypothetical protein
VLDRFGGDAFARAGADVIERIKRARGREHARDRSANPGRNDQSASHRSM